MIFISPLQNRMDSGCSGKVFLSSIEWETCIRKMGDFFILFVMFTSTLVHIVVWNQSNVLISMHRNSYTYSPFEWSRIELVPLFLKDFITLSVSDYECIQNRQPSTYTTQITVLYMNCQGSTLAITKQLSHKPFRNFSYQRFAALDWP